MRMLIPLLLFSFFTTPLQLVEQMLRVTTVDLPRIEIAGTRVEQTPVAVTIAYDPVKDEVTFTEQESKQVWTAQTVPPWLRLFCRKKSEAKPEEAAAAFIEYLKKLGIDPEKKSLSTTGPEGDLIYLIGRDDPHGPAPFLALYRSNHLPQHLRTGGIDARFSDYHKSRLPLIFPGRIEVTENERTTVYLFVRDEYR